MITNQVNISGKGTPRVPRYPENLSNESIFPIPANQSTLKVTLLKEIKVQNLNFQNLLIYCEYFL